jgi:hypothetical protein
MHSSLYTENTQVQMWCDVGTEWIYLLCRLGARRGVLCRALCFHFSCGDKLCLFPTQEKSPLPHKIITRWLVKETRGNDLASIRVYFDRFFSSAGRESCLCQLWSHYCGDYLLTLVLQRVSSYAVISCPVKFTVFQQELQIIIDNCACEIIAAWMAESYVSKIVFKY